MFKTVQISLLLDRFGKKGRLEGALDRGWERGENSGFLWFCTVLSIILTVLSKRGLKPGGGLPSPLTRFTVGLPSFPLSDASFPPVSLLADPGSSAA